MDPEACLERAELAVECKDWREASDAIEDYRRWRSRGGFEPENGDSRERVVRAALPEKLTCPEGWRGIATGGGCDAWYLDLGDREVLITDDNGASPEWEGQLQIGMYRKIEGQIAGSDPIGYEEGTLAECLAWLALNHDLGKSIDLSAYRNADGSLAQHTSLGSYTILYCGPDKDGTPVYCAECAASHQIASVGPFWEGEPEICEDCGDEIESSYGPVEGDDDHGSPEDEERSYGPHVAEQRRLRRLKEGRE